MVRSGLLLFGMEPTQKKKAVCHKETARCHSCSFQFKVRRQPSFESHASELQTHQHKTEFNAKWPFELIQGHVFWSQWKGDKALSHTSSGGSTHLYLGWLKGWRRMCARGDTKNFHIQSVN